ncbi:hypothetical protein [Coleofasciculus sp. LEGE 07092]|uniref:hypothetical protein n=2 Tax=unclassified Coleofasciculus TaxID=2692782 RepID=UPI00187FF2A0|nr:hypothetical protein [Coleofasciculus sp. LEGE 07092]MBE9125401.1 hypothetical protein [Coleofasciculus sp. LEGE 07081]MBE9147382.1 hypothetical protein [Coleofasciculus sp. LEGE 07092]
MPSRSRSEVGRIGKKEVVMNAKDFVLQVGFGLILGTAGGVWEMLPASAQTDTSGSIITSGDIVNGAFVRGSARDEVLVFRTPQIENAVNSAASVINQRLEQRNLPVVANGTPTAIPASVQQNLGLIVTGEGNVGLSVTQIQNALINAGASQTLAQNLASSLPNLTAGGRVEAAQLVNVIEVYNALINASDFDLLNEPPEELRAIQAVLTILLNAARSQI